MTPLYVPPRLWHAKGLSLLGRILLAYIESGTAATDGELAVELEVKEEHIARTLGNLQQMKLIVREEAALRVTELGAQYWLPDHVPFETETPAKPPAQGALTGGAFDCGSETKTQWAQGAMRPRDKDPPPALRGCKGPLMRQITQTLQGGYTVSADLFDLLPPEVILAIHRGEPCFPIAEAKKPLVKWAPLQQRTPSPDELRKWTRQFYGRIWGWGRVTGRVSNLIVLDDDGGGWLEKWGLEPHIATRRGGFHWIGEYPGWRVRTVNAVSSKALGDAFPKLDIRADGGYSVICNGKGEYEWLREPKPDPLDLLPSHARRFFGLDSPPKPQRKVESQSVSLPLGGDRVELEYLLRRAVDIARGQGRNTGAMWLSVQMKDNGYSQHEAEAAGRAYIGQVPLTDTRGDVDPYSDTEMQATVRWAFQQPRREPWRKQ